MAGVIKSVSEGVKVLYKMAVVYLKVRRLAKMQDRLNRGAENLIKARDAGTITEQQFTVVFGMYRETSDALISKYVKYRLEARDVMNAYKRALR